MMTFVWFDVFNGTGNWVVNGIYNIPGDHRGVLEQDTSNTHLSYSYA